MIHWKETREILARLADLEATGRRAALATVVRIAGSSYRRPGAKFLIEDAGETLGSVSGGCLEADVREVGLGVLGGGGPRLRHYDTGTDEDTVWGLGLGCDGMVEVFVQSATEGPWAEAAPRLRELLEGDEAVAVVSAVDTDGAHGGGGPLLVTGGETLGSLGSADLDRRATGRARELLEAGRSTLDPVDGRPFFFDVLEPPRHLLVCGAGDDACPLVTYAAAAAFRVTVVDHRPALLAEGRFPEALRTVRGRPEDGQGLPAGLPGGPSRSLAVVMTHSLRHDREWVRRLLDAGVPYVGILGPRKRIATIREEAGAEGDPRVYGPVGLDLGADGPHQVALSVVAELLAFVSGREPRHLAEREEAIHAV